MPDQPAVRVRFALPPRVLHPNGRTRNPRARWAATKRWRTLVGQLARIAALEQLGSVPGWREADCQITITYGRRQQKQDDDNLIGWLKFAYDGIQDAGVISNDRRLVHLPPVHRRGELAGIEIEIRGR